MPEPAKIGADTVRSDLAASDSPAATTALRAVATSQDVVAFAANVLFIGNSTRTWATLANSLNDLGVTNRSSLSVDQVFGLRAREMPEVLLLDDDAAGLEQLDFVRRVIANPRLRDIPIVVLSSDATLSAKLAAFAAGVVDYVCIPCDPRELLVRVVAHLRQRRTQLESEQHARRLEAFVLEQFNEIMDSQMATIVALARLAESRDDQTGGHLERTQQYCRRLAEKLSEQASFSIIDHTFIDNIEYASALHDIGKVAISDLILLKPSELTDAEFETMKTHTVLGAQTLEAVSEKYPNNDFIAMGIKIARWHHERWDGTGYPDGLAGESIPLPARIMAVADVYDALMSHRSYKHSFTHSDSCDIIALQAGLQFDPEVVSAFIELQSEFASISQG